ncbi:riboflavin kinase [Coccinella septempunctata]|uniref:riboflavin kinase n=1 Tax=Coccinella septempunctata TaxID=41139 RepID=UPI001D070B7B|nr:riboflavin kinase [Coccinella septempunctata]XP_044744216.1 riboflavin kinase [Coccinella septempunctata]XP_044744217.1 riboflavin kinase [Coccinella septempunctata]
MKTYLPHFTTGMVVKGFGRGSKQLGIPTANFPEEVVNNLPEEMETGVYYGFSQVDDGPVYKMVMSIGWNPYYKNEKKSMETHILHKFEEDFYGRLLKVVVLDYVRPEMNFNSLDDLIDTIKSDISIAEKNLDKPEFVGFQKHEFFS